MDSLLTAFIPNLRCPITHASLELIDSDTLTSVNQAITEGRQFHYDGTPVKEPLSEALTTPDGQYLYAVIDENIAILFEPLAIIGESKQSAEEETVTTAATTKAATTKAAFSSEKKIVLDFYEDFGWKKDQENLFKDTKEFEDRRGVAADYWSRCHLRLNRYLSQGEYILDVASGAIPNDEYFTYSDNFRVRICMDFSLLALKEAAQRLDNQGIFILGDVTQIPMVDRCVDSIISLNTVYHVPQAEQTQSVAEMYRILKPGSEAVIIYSWPEPLLMKAAFRFWRNTYGRIKKKKRATPQPSSTTSPSHRPQLFINQQEYSWYKNVIKPQFNSTLKVYSSLSRSFSNTFIKEKAFGKQLASFIFWLESTFPRFFGRYGQYPVFVLKKVL